MTDKEKKGIDLTVKSLRNQYPFVKGWYMVDGSYTYVFHISLLVDPIEAINYIAEKYDVEIYPSGILLGLIKRRPKDYDSTVLMLYSSAEGEGGEMLDSKDDAAWNSLFEITYKLKQDMNDRLFDGYSLLPDDYKIEAQKGYKIPMIHRYRITPEKD